MRPPPPAAFLTAYDFFLQVEHDYWPRTLRRRAAAFKPGVGAGGFSRSSSTRTESRSDKEIRSALAMISRAAASSNSCFSSRVVHRSMRPSQGVCARPIVPPFILKAISVQLRPQLVSYIFLNGHLKGGKTILFSSEEPRQNEEI